MDISGAHVLVTGASRGIGEALARELASRGARVTLAARSTAALSGLAREIGGTVLTTDLATSEGRKGLVAQAEEAGGGHLDILVNNAGVDMARHIADLSRDDLERLVSVNVLAVMELTRQAVPGMIERRHGHILNISSLSAAFAGPGIAAYSASRAAISQFTASLRFDLDGTGVGATVVEAGFLETHVRTSILSHEPMARLYRRFVRMGALVDTPLDTLARGAVDGMETGKATVRYPGRVRPALALVDVPRRMTWLFK